MMRPDIAVKSRTRNPVLVLWLTCDTITRVAGNFVSTISINYNARYCNTQFKNNVQIGQNRHSNDINFYVYKQIFRQRQSFVGGKICFEFEFCRFLFTKKYAVRIQILIFAKIC